MITTKKGEVLLDGTGFHILADVSCIASTIAEKMYALGLTKSDVYMALHKAVDVGLNDNKKDKR